VERTAEIGMTDISAVRFTDYDSSGLPPSTEVLGYCQIVRSADAKATHLHQRI
jgi:hypothetical protein